MKRDLTRWIIALGFLTALLYVGRALFIPLCFSFLISFAGYPLCRWLEDKKNWPRSLAITACLLALLAFVGVLTAVAVIGIAELANQKEIINDQIQIANQQFREFMTDQFSISKERQDLYLQQLGTDALSSLAGVLRSFMSFSASALATLVIIPVFVALILASREILVAALMSAVPVKHRLMCHEILHESITTFYEFVKGMAIVYLFVGIMNTVGLVLLGVPNAIFFGFLASILTMIPYVGILIGGAVPVALALTDGPAKALGVVAVFTIVQYLEANVIFPRAVGHRLKINTLMMLVSLIAGGILWGGAGLILTPPIIGILKIISDKVPSWRPLAILLDDKPPLSKDNQEKT